MKASEFVKLRVGDTFEMNYPVGRRLCRIVETKEVQDEEDWRWCQITYDFAPNMATIMIRLPAQGELPPIHESSLREPSAPAETDVG
jgi:hypothetical protein